MVRRLVLLVTFLQCELVFRCLSKADFPLVGTVMPHKHPRRRPLCCFGGLSVACSESVIQWKRIVSPHALQKLLG